jgi:hypothetical protein
MIKGAIIRSERGHGRGFLEISYMRWTQLDKLLVSSSHYEGYDKPTQLSDEIKRQELEECGTNPPPTTPHKLHICPDT